MLTTRCCQSSRQGVVHMARHGSTIFETTQREILSASLSLWSHSQVTFQSSTPSFSQGPRFAEHLTQVRRIEKLNVASVKAIQNDTNPCKSGKSM